ncbi:MAG TPA: hypothetical protein VLK24_10600 [Gaiellaceae bacterium]|nr:hypothetical protein [Gaiellaceae bacterium]
MSRKLVYAILGGAAIGALAWLDPIFIPLVLLGPLVSGFVVGRRGGEWRYLALAWAIGGVSMLVSDWIVNNEDRAFHAAITVAMVALASAAWWGGRRLGGRREVARQAV